MEHCCLATTCLDPYQGAARLRLLVIRTVRSVRDDVILAEDIFPPLDWRSWSYLLPLQLLLWYLYFTLFWHFQWEPAPYLRCHSRGLRPRNVNTVPRTAFSLRCPLSRSWQKFCPSVSNTSIDHLDSHPSLDYSAKFRQVSQKNKKCNLQVLQ